MIRGLVREFEGTLRLNAIAPSWTDTGIVPADFFESVGVLPQTPEAVARSVVLLFADQQRHGDVIYSWDNKFKEVNRAKGGLLDIAEKMLDNSANEDRVMATLKEMMAEAKQ